MEGKLVMQHTGLSPSRNVIVVRPSSNNKEPKFCNKTPDLSTLF